MRAEVLSHIGHVRKQNQDRFLVDTARGLFVVCDGMGGHKAGEVAAQIAVDTLNQTFTHNPDEKPHVSLTRSIIEANQRIFLKSHEGEEYSDMGTTITAAMIENMTLYAASIGDSSLFVITSSGIVKITEEHTLAQKLFQEGLLNEQELDSNKYRHVLTRALGLDETVEIDCFTCPLKDGDIIVLTTDGLTDLVRPNEIRTIICRQSDQKTGLEDLTHLALERGGHDNITVILITVP